MAAPVIPEPMSRGSAPVFGERLAAAQAPKRPSGVVIGSAVAAGVLIIVGVLAALRFSHKGGTAAPPPAPAPAPVAAAPVAAPRPDSARHDSAAAAAAAMGYVRVIGDLPDGVILWLDSTEEHGRTFATRPGSYNFEVETDEFEPWEKRVTVRAGDTTKVNVELVLKADSTQKPDSLEHR